MHKNTDNMKDLNVAEFACCGFWFVFSSRTLSILFAGTFIGMCLMWEVDFFLNTCLCCLENVVEQMSSSEDEDIAKIEKISGKIKMRIRIESRIFLAQNGTLVGD